jgi:hypothetical protein
VGLTSSGPPCIVLAMSIEKSAKLKTVATYVFEYIDLEKLVKEVYGHEIHILRDERFIDYERLGHFTYHEWTVDGASELQVMVDDIIVQKWIETGNLDHLDMTDVVLEDGSPYWSTETDVGLRHIMHRLFIDGHIPAGKYLMKVDW